MLPSLGTQQQKSGHQSQPESQVSGRAQLRQGRSGECSQLEEIANDEEEQGQGQDDVEV